MSLDLQSFIGFSGIGFSTNIFDENISGGMLEMRRVEERYIQLVNNVRITNILISQERCARVG